MIPSIARSRIIAFILFLGAAFQRPAPPPAPAAAPQQFAISREVNLVVLPVTVRNRQGQFVTGLTASDFRVYEDGRPQTIANFQSEDAPVTVGLLVDHSGSMAGRRREVIDGAVAFVEESNPEDEEFILNFADKVVFGLAADVRFTGNPQELKAALSAPYASGRTALNDAVVAALQHLNSPRADKKVIVLISDGGDNASHYTFAQALSAAQAANVVIYTVALLDEDSADQNPKALRMLAKETGGLAYFPSTPADVVRVCRQIAADIRHQYTIAYSPAGERRNEYRKIRLNIVAANQGKLEVRTRAGYFWPPIEATGSARNGR